MILLLALNIYVFHKRKGIADRKNMEELQNRETELERMLMNPAAQQTKVEGKQFANRKKLILCRHRRMDKWE